ncbi:methyltransferase domain-containing protein [Agarivorans sp. JK6]|uniref:methyltransferase domain-containing protein n=1 Tax=Agarivorans sp. JK6 TaxID=2997426 RepID=UPI0038732D5A
MKPAKIREVIASPDFWQELPLGDWLMEQQQSLLDQHLPVAFGYHMLKLGNLSAQLNCHASMIRHQLNVAKQGHLIGLRAHPEQLPFQESSIDLCLLAHSLDFSKDPHQILREVERVLTADGYLIISGFNPFSLLGMRRYFPFRKRGMPWSCRMFTPARVKDWLNLLGFEVLNDERFAYTSFVNSRPAPQWFERWGKRYFRATASAYFIVARKRRAPLTPVKKAWRVKQRIPVPSSISG